MSDITLKPSSPAILSPPDWRKPAMAGYFVIVLMFGIVGGWSTIATLDQAVEAPGVVTVEAGRQSVSHLEDGIIEQILVKEGQHVDKGQVLFRLSPIQALAQFDLAQNQLDADLILEARLLAERDQLPTIKLPEVIASRASEPAIARIIDDQTTQFNDRTASVQGQVNVLNARIQQVQREIDGLKIEKDSTEKQVGYIRYELVGLRELLDKRLVPLDRVLSMERERTRLEGLIGKSITDQAKAEGLIGETRLQIAQLKQKFQEETAAAILEARQKITDLRQKEAVAKDILHRVDIRAAQTGKLQGSRVTTVGQIIRSAEQLAEIVPDSDSLLVRVQFSPNDIDNIHEGQEAEIRFPSFNLRTVPIIMGRLQTVSTDRLLDDANNKQPYYLGLVAVSKMEVPPELEKRLKAGMPAEVIVASGERSVLSYFISPLRDSMRKAFIEK